MNKKYNPKSRENLKQFRQAKEKKQLNKAIKEISKSGIDTELLQTIIPVEEIFLPDEVPRFYKYFKHVITELEEEDVVKFWDYEDVAQLCKNKILEDRFLKSAAKVNEEAAAASFLTAAEKLKRENAKLKEQLGVFRRERFDPRDHADFTVLDVISIVDREHKEKIKERNDRYEKEEKEISKNIKTSLDELIT
jgi:hypothetical protein